MSATLGSHWQKHNAPAGWTPSLGATTTVYDTAPDGSTFKAIVFGGRVSAQDSNANENQLYILQYDGGSLRWFWLEGCKGESPVTRYGHSFSVLSRKFLLFGGKTLQGSFLSDPHVFCMAYGGWLPQKNIKGLTTNCPRSRAYHTCNVLPSLTAVIFGGSTNSGPVNDVCLYTPTAEGEDGGDWSSQKVMGTPPCPRFGHTATMVGSNVYIFGGTTEQTVLNDIWILNTDNWRWDEVLTGGVTPDARAFHSLVNYEQQYLITYGGTNLRTTYQDFFCLNLGTNRWSSIKALDQDMPGQQGSGPTARMGHRSFVCGDKVFVHAGSNGSTAHTDVLIASISEYADPVTASVDMDEVKGIAERVIKDRMKLTGMNPDSIVPVPREDTTKIIFAAKHIFQQEHSLLTVESSSGCHVFGDLHGQFFDLLRFFQHFGCPEGFGGMMPETGKDTKFLFLGDYVDRGRYSIDVVTLLYAYKIMFPEKVFMIRGNHEDEAMNCHHGFFDECRRTFDYQIWHSFNLSFSFMPVAAVLQNRIFCCHGGISPHLHTMAQIAAIRRPVSTVGNPQDTPLLSDLLWSDPSTDPDAQGFIYRYPHGKRGCSYDFGEDVLHKFLDANNMDMLVRAHELVQDGFELWGRGRLITLFSAANYCGEYDNAAAMMVVHPNLRIDFKVLRPEGQGAAGNEGMEHSYSKLTSKGTKRSASPPRRGSPRGGKSGLSTIQEKR